jgi:anhydro-N-acetylmuramic acid kinase
MQLREVLQVAHPVVVGLNSGTSADSIDLAAVRYRGEARVPEFLGGRTKPFDLSLKQSIEATIDSRHVNLEDLVYLDNLLGSFFGRAASAFIRQLDRKGIPVHAVASHGQTIRHFPKGKRFDRRLIRGTLQIGSPEFISVATGKVVVSDFRQSDIAMDGEGAPITVAAMRRLFGDRREARLIVNIGGMANYFYFPAGGDPAAVRAADCGPGNALVDLLCRRLFKMPYDRNGAHARAGTVCQPLLGTLRKQSFFSSRRVSTGREEFGADLVERILKLGKKYQLSEDDLVATAAELSVYGIVRSVQRLSAHIEGVKNLYLTGGGSHNKFFVHRLRKELPSVAIASVRKLGVDPDLVEAASYAIMGVAALRSQGLPTRFGQSSKGATLPVCGRITQPPEKVKNG